MIIIYFDLFYSNSVLIYFYLFILGLQLSNFKISFSYNDILFYFILDLFQLRKCFLIVLVSLNNINLIICWIIIHFWWLYVIIYHLSW